MNKFIFVLFSLVFSFSSFAQRTYNVVDYGAVGNKMVDDAKAIQTKIKNKDKLSQKKKL